MTKQQKTLFEHDPFFCYGRVFPDEYDWKAQFSQVAKENYKSPHCFVLLDIGKVLGLATYAADLEFRMAGLEK